MDEMLDFRPYVLQCTYEWIMDCLHVPMLVVSLDHPELEIPDDWYRDADQIVFNINEELAMNIGFGSEGISFRTLWDGQLVDVFIPIDSIRSLYSEQTKRGINVQPKSYESTMTPNLELISCNPDSFSSKVSESAKGDKSKKDRPNLRIVR